MSNLNKEAAGLCNTIRRNGYDAYVINARLQELLAVPGSVEVDIATEMSLDDLLKIFPHAQSTTEPAVVALLKENGSVFRFYHSDSADASHPETTLVHLTPRMQRKLQDMDAQAYELSCAFMPCPVDDHAGFEDFGKGIIQFAGLPDETLRHNYMLGLRALRYAANYSLPLEPNTRVAIVRGAQRILDYASISDIMDEWRKVEAENLADFVQLLFDAQLLHGIMPEVAALSRVLQIRNERGEEETVFAHTIEVMRRYPEELPYDWYGTMACLFHEVGKLYTAEYYDSRWHFHQHHRVGAKVVRKMLARLRFAPDDIDLICHLVLNHMRFKYMLTDRGIRRFKALYEYPRLIEIARADIKARDTTYTEFNHNMKMLERADIPEEALEPLLNGNEIMDFTGLRPGPGVGIIREALLQAQVEGKVSSIPDAVEFVQRYKDREKLS
ncbi:MAG: HD domain-containing protein [Desulfovibrionaceae bacterium]|jgi:poly(A) polymerase|nr:HD domain-containing protein [Desulfovibrionaceae bacterium]